MQASHLLLEEPIRMASILEPSKASFFPAMTKIVGTLGPRSRSVEVISACLKVGMSVARIDFSWGDAEYHQETLENLKIAIKSTKKLCAVMLDTVGPELQVVNRGGSAITLKADDNVILPPDQGQETSFEVLPISYAGLAKVDEVKDDDVVCVIKNSATMAGSLFTLHASQVHIDLPCPL